MPFLRHPFEPRIMTSKGNIQILDSLVKLTSIHDPGLLELALIEDISRLVKHGKVKLFRARSHDEKIDFVQDGHDDVPASLDGHLEALMRKAVRSGQKQSSTSGGKNVQVLPLIGAHVDVTSLVVIQSAAADGEWQYPAEVELKVFHNLIGLISDNERDALTRLFNRKTFDKKIGKILSDLRYYGHRAGETEHYRSCFLAEFDIDFFKRVNDQFGHLLGDEVLILLATLMRKIFRDDDLLFRFGGEEFVCVIRNVNQELAIKAFERFRATVEEYPFPQVGKVTVSIGVTEILANDLTSSLIDRADKALYFAKAHGRNQVAVHEVLVAEGHLEARDLSGEMEMFGDAK